MMLKNYFFHVIAFSLQEILVNKNTTKNEHCVIYRPRLKLIFSVLFSKFTIKTTKSVMINDILMQPISSDQFYDK